MSTQSTIPKDGYYVANVQLDTGGERAMYVQVKGGKPLDEWGRELLPDACRDFREVRGLVAVSVWPKDAGMELDALRKSMDTLRKTLEIEDGRDCLEEVFQMRNEVQALRTANAGLVEKVKRLEEVGDGLAEIAGKFGHGLFVHERKDAWSQAKGQP